MMAIEDSCVLTLDVGGTSVKSALVASGGHIIDQPVVTPINSAAGANTILSTFTDIIRHHLARVDAANLLGLAIGFPGPFDYQHGVSYIKGVAKYEALYGVNVKDALQTRLALRHIPVLFRNDAEAAILGEALYGAGRSYHRLIGVTLGTGCGSAFVADGAPVTEGQGVPANGWLYPLPFQGQQADDVFSIRGLTTRLRKASVTTDIKLAADLARQGDNTARQVFIHFGHDLGAFLLPFTADFQAEAILILGGIAHIYDLFGSSLGRVLPVPILPGQLGPDAALLGAAELLLDT